MSKMSEFDHWLKGKNLKTYLLLTKPGEIDEKAFGFHMRDWLSSNAVSRVSRDTRTLDNV